MCATSMTRFRGIFSCLLFLCCCLNGSAHFEDCTSSERLGDGICDHQYNYEACSYDGGDCCDCTSELGDDLTAYFANACRDPNSECVDPRVEMYSNCTEGHIEHIGDADCDAENNNEACSYDGGDCCDCTSSSSQSSIFGDVGHSHCLDPDSGCIDVRATAFANCSGDLAFAGDGFCDYFNNNPSCGYDWGDCCLCTNTIGDEFYYWGLVKQASSYSSIDCVDPEAPTELYNCEEAPSTVVPCPAEPSVHELVVETTAQARDLAEAVNCSGGTFEVEWRASVVVDKTIRVSDGTVLKIRGLDLRAAMDGNGITQVLSVFNASLQLFDMNISNGNAIFGGAIAASASSLSFTRTSFINNTAVGNGGAIVALNGCNISFSAENSFSNNRAGGGGSLYVGRGSHVSWAGGIAFYDNAALIGGALWLTEDGRASWAGHTQFYNNTAQYSCGAVCVTDNSSVSWEGRTFFSGNIAESFDGGALVVAQKSGVYWEGETAFVRNYGFYGGAMSVIFNSTVSWRGKATFSENVAVLDGGAVYLYDDSNAFWEEETTFWGNSAEWGGGVYIGHDTSAFWEGETNFTGNFVNGGGGALLMFRGSSASWGGKTTFIGNSAKGSGGAVYAYIGSTTSYKGETVFAYNFGDVGGAVYIIGGSSVSYEGETIFWGNSASHEGGAMALISSNVLWTGQINVLGNNATSHGGALWVTYGSNISWTAETYFSSNNAGLDGGALYAVAGSNVYWSARTVFSRNSADDGGAVLITNGATVEWSGKTDFEFNTAHMDGGAVGSKAYSFNIFSDINYANDQESYVIVKGITNFTNNTSGAYGGAMALMGMLSVTFEEDSVIFMSNSADVAGGAVVISDTGMGPMFHGTTFISNSAQVGGAVYLTGSGTSITTVRDQSGSKTQVYNPTTFDACTFISNVADATGGAVDSSAGRDEFRQTKFERNSAAVGGALRLAGESFLDNCSFVENVSGSGEGPAVSNIGFMSIVTGNVFRANVFSCDPGMFLVLLKSGDPFGEVCDGCSTECKGCDFSEQQVPACISLSEAGVENAESVGGVVTVKDLVVKEGYWRATSESTDILKCYNPEACPGGVTSGHCSRGYQGPYCSVCSENYVARLSYTCEKCTISSAGTIALAVFLGTVCIAVGVTLIMFLVARETEGTRRGIVDRVTRYIPTQSVKIIIVAWQILTQLSSVANVTYPNVYQDFLDGVNFLNFDLGWVVSAGCFVDFDFHDRLLIMTIGPIVTLGLLGMTYIVAVRRNCASEVALRNVRHKHMSMALLLTFLVYSTVSSVVFQTFACEKLDDSGNYLRADYSIKCTDEKHQDLMVYAACMIALYPVGIPIWYASLLFKNSDVLENKANRKKSLAVKSISNLWEPYKPSRFYYEVVECGRRILLTGVAVFIFPDSPAQIATILMMAFIFAVMSEVLSPFESRWDAWINRAGHSVVFVSMYLALLLKVDMSEEDEPSQELFEIILVAAHGCMVLGVLVETGAMACALRVERESLPCQRVSPNRP